MLAPPPTISAMSSVISRRPALLSRTSRAFLSQHDDVPHRTRPGTPLRRHLASGPAAPRKNRCIYVAATKQHVGKTSTSLALVSGLQKRFDRVGFMKPVGQQHVTVRSRELGRDVRVDKDVTLMREHFGLSHVDYRYMSPVIIPRGYTKDFIDGKITVDEQLTQISESYEAIDTSSDIVLAEGTGHVAVGSIVQANNARVAALMGADMVLIANGGLGSAFDELELNRVLCQHHGVRVAGVIINKVIPEKYEQTKDYMTRALMDNWGVPLLGCIPDRHFLGCPAIADLERLFKTKLISGSSHVMRHYSIAETNLVTTSLGTFMSTLRHKPSRTLYLCHVTRNDVILGFLGEYQRRLKVGDQFEATLVLCGRKGKYSLSTDMADMIRSWGAPVLHVEESTFRTMEMINNFTPKLNIDDKHRVKEAINHYEKYIDFDELLRRTSSGDDSFDEPA